MTSQEQYKLIEEVCTEVKASLQKEADRLRKMVEDFGDKNSPEWRIRIKEKAADYMEAQITVSAVPIRMQSRLIPEMVKELESEK